MFFEVFFLVPPNSCLNNNDNFCFVSQQPSGKFSQNKSENVLSFRKTSGAECVPAVFIVTSLRTASTSILHMLNQIPGLLDDFNQCRVGKGGRDGDYEFPGGK